VLLHRGHDPQGSLRERFFSNRHRTCDWLGVSRLGMRRMVDGTDSERILQHNAHFWDKACHFRHSLTPVSTPLAPRGPRDREPLCLRSCSRMPQNLLPFLPPTLSSTTFAGPKHCEPKMASHALRTGSTKHGGLCSIITWSSSTTNMDALLTTYFPLPYRGTPMGMGASYPHNYNHGLGTYRPALIGSCPIANAPRPNCHTRDHGWRKSQEPF
jgi:hypothetical protein